MNQNYNQRDAHCLLLDIDMRRRIPVLDDFIRSIFIFLLIIIFLWPFLVLYGLYKLIKSIIEKSCFKCKRPFSMNVTSEKKLNHIGTILKSTAALILGSKITNTTR